MLEKASSWLVEGGDGNDVGETGQVNVSEAGAVADKDSDGEADAMIWTDVAVAGVVVREDEAVVCASKVEIPTEMDVAEIIEGAAVGKMEGDRVPSLIFLIWLIWLISSASLSDGE